MYAPTNALLHLYLSLSYNIYIYIANEQNQDDILEKL